MQEEQLDDIKKNEHIIMLRKHSTSKFYIDE